MAIKLKILSVKLKTMEPENLAGSGNVAITEPVPVEKKKRKLTAASLKQDAEDVQSQVVKEELSGKEKIAEPAIKDASPIRKTRKATGSKASRKKEEEKKFPEPADKEVYIHDYSERSFAVFGNTKPIKDRLKAIGGKFNPRLHPFGADNDVPGWIFPLKARAAVERIVY